MAMTTAQKWRKTLTWLRREFPLRFSVNVRSHKGLKFCGITDFNNRHFQIKIQSDTSLQIRIDTVIHEWAHALTWFGADQSEDHSDEWGLAHAKIYRAHNKWNYGRKGSMDD